jgi:hypothetical protein
MRVVGSFRCRRGYGGLIDVGIISRVGLQPINFRRKLFKGAVWKGWIKIIRYDIHAFHSPNIWDFTHPFYLPYHTEVPNHTKRAG